MHLRTGILLFVFAGTLPSRSAPVYETVVSFETPPQAPKGGLVLAADGNYYGTSSEGGQSGFGTVFRMTPAGVCSVVVHFTGTAGSAPGSHPLAGLTVGADGALYGTTSSGGAGDCGTIFKVSTTGVFSSLVSFTGLAGAAKGSAPESELLLHSDGNFYGTTSGGGYGELGTIFRMTPAGVFATLAQFTGTGGGVRGSNPSGRLVQSSAGAVFGTTRSGGAGDLGTVYKITTAGTYTALLQFTGTGGNTRGSNPVGGLVLASDSNLYGVTESGGVNDLGTFFRMTPSGAHTRLYDFDGLNGSSPSGALTQAVDGLLYGATSAGGASNRGLLYRFTLAGAISTMAEFSGVSGTAPGSECEGALITGADGQLYGTTTSGGLGNNGTVFKTSALAVFSHLSDFTMAAGWNPAGGISTGPDGNLYVCNADGGAGGCGTVVRMTPQGSTTPVVTFTGISGSTRGDEPVGTLITGKDGAMYGMTRLGGASDGGTAFKLTAAGAVSPVSAFGTTVGTRPMGGFTMDAAGAFYGTASSGGLGGFGSVFGMTSSGTRGRIASFTGVDGSSPGAAPVGGLALAADGSLYGATRDGGAADMGTLFRLTPANVHVPLVSFQGANGANPACSPVVGPDGKLYGTTSAGGAQDQGTIYQITSSGVHQIIHSFAGTDGSDPAGPLLIAPDGVMYGTTSLGGANGFGGVFRTTRAGPPEMLFHFTGSGGAVPGDLITGALAFGPEGNLYGTTSAGGALNGGTVFRIRQLGPHAGTLGSRALGLTEMRLFASVVTGGENTHVSWQYGPTPALGSEQAGPDLPASGPVTTQIELAGLEPRTTYYFRVVATNPSGASTGEIKSFKTPAPFTLWKLQHLGSSNAPSLADPDGDTLNNLLEYMLGLDPAAPSASPVMATTGSGVNPELCVSFDRDPARNDLTIDVQGADTPNGPWTTISTSSAGNPFAGEALVEGDGPGAGLRHVVVHDVVRIHDRPARFLRLSVSP